MAVLQTDDQGKPIPQIKTQNSNAFESWEGKNGHGNVRSNDGMIETLGSKSDSAPSDNTSAASIVSLIRKLIDDIAILATISNNASTINSHTNSISIAVSNVRSDISNVQAAINNMGGTIQSAISGQTGDMMSQFGSNIFGPLSSISSNVSSINGSVNAISGNNTSNFNTLNANINSLQNTLNNFIEYPFPNRNIGGNYQLSNITNIAAGASSSASWVYTTAPSTNYILQSKKATLYFTCSKACKLEIKVSDNAPATNVFDILGSDLSYLNNIPAGSHAVTVDINAKNIGFIFTNLDSTETMNITNMDVLLQK